MKSRLIFFLSLSIIVVAFAVMFIPLWSVERIVFKGDEVITSVSTYNVLKVASDRSIFYDEFKFVTPLSIAFVVISFVCAITMAIIGIKSFGEKRKRILKIVGVSSASTLSIVFLFFMIIGFVTANSYSFLATSVIQKGTGLGEISFILIFVMCFVYSFFLLRDPFKTRTKKIKPVAPKAEEPSSYASKHNNQSALCIEVADEVVNEQEIVVDETTSIPRHTHGKVIKKDINHIPTLYIVEFDLSNGQKVIANTTLRFISKK